jgi:PTH1 family peptidyl-tRNA hydrolase
VTRIRLIVGLGNPGPQYAKTRHNAGFWFLDELARQHHLSLRSDSKFHGLTAKFDFDSQPILLLAPQDFMNRSGYAVAAMSKYWRLPPEEILVVHDELDFPPGTVRHKREGGHGGHNGLRNIIEQLGANNFCRLRIGIGHPGDRNKVTDYVLGAPPTTEDQAIREVIDRATAPTVFRAIVECEASPSIDAQLKRQ